MHLVLTPSPNSASCTAPARACADQLVHRVWMVWTFGGRGKSHFGRHFSSLIPDRISSSSPPLPAVRLASIQQMIKVGWVCMPSLSLSGHGRRPTDMTGANWTNWRCDKGITRLISSRASILQTEVEGVRLVSLIKIRQDALRFFLPHYTTCSNCNCV